MRVWMRSTSQPGMRSLLSRSGRVSTTPSINLSCTLQASWIRTAECPATKECSSLWTRTSSQLHHRSKWSRLPMPSSETPSLRTTWARSSRWSLPHTPSTSRWCQDSPRATTRARTTASCRRGTRRGMTWATKLWTEQTRLSNRTRPLKIE